MTSGRISRSSAALLFVGGLSLSFVPDIVLPRLSPDFPASAHWLGQLLGAAWLAVAALNWQSRNTIIGGIYGRPVQMVNFVLYWIGGTVLLKEAQRPGAPQALWVLAIPTLALALTYMWLMFRGPLAGDRKANRAS